MHRMIYLIGVIAIGVGCSEHTEHTWFRSIGGISNNRSHITWGTAHMALPRKTAPTYADGISSPAGQDRPSPRYISNELFEQLESVPDPRGLSDWVWQWGQFISHDLSLTEPLAIAPEPFNVLVPPGDPVFDLAGTGVQTIPFVRSVYQAITGTHRTNPRQQINQVTSFLDGSHIYGSDTARDVLLRKDGGKSAWMLSSDDTNGDGEYLLPRNIFDAGNCNYGHPQPRHLYLSGDVRTNEVPGLIVLHTVWMREHNRLVRELSARYPKASADYLFEYARKWVGAQMQVITYQEFLPALLGPYAPGLGGSYDEHLDPTVTNEFSTVLFRFGHSMIPSQLQRVGPHGRREPPIPLSDAFFDPNWVSRSIDLDTISRGMAVQLAQNVDLKVVNELRNFLFKGTLGRGLDLSALNIQRGRDHGIASYNTLRESFGLAPVSSFSEITAEKSAQQALQTVYGSVDYVDAWVGALAEDHLQGASLGPLMVAGLQDMFWRLRDGDRFWFERDPLFTIREIEELKATRLSTVIRRNTGASDIPDDLFHVSGR